MAEKVNPIPEGFHSITPHLVIRDCAKAIDYYKQVFDAEEVMRMPGPDGKIGHAEVRIGDSRIMMADEFPDWGSLAPESIGGSPVALMLYVEDVDATFERAVAAGATVKMPLANQFWGDRYGKIVDPFGHEWSLATHVEDITPEEMETRAKAAQAAMAQKP